jgi:tRNA modification GTPase
MPDTIAAIATAPAAAAVGIVRLSGAETRRVLAALFTPVDGRSAAELPPRRMTYGTVRDAEGRTLDHALAVVFSAGHSYTGEESAELHCHGSPVVLQEVLRAAFAAGARQARAGEFTERAFLNGKMDLTEAEAVIDLIDAETAEAARNAAAQVDGALRRPLEQVYDALLGLTSRFYAVVDYPDEDIEDLTLAETERTLTESEQTLAALLGTFARGRVLKSGAATAIVGAPNAGKSSLLNALVGYDRAIVTDLPGTTRDTVEEKAVVGGVLLRLIDTAGLHETDDLVEQLGVERSKKAVEDADLILALLDGSTGLPASEARAAEMLAPLELAAKSGKPWLLLLTKSDLGGGVDIVPDKDWRTPEAVISLSSVTHEGFEALEAAIRTLYPAPKGDTSLVTNARQADAIRRALDSVRAAKDALQSGMTPDVVLTEVEQAENALGELTGRTAREDMVARIFERFCVGK